MPNVSETRIAVNLHDGASTGLQHLNSQYSRFSNTIQNIKNIITIKMQHLHSLTDRLPGQIWAGLHPMQTAPQAVCLI